MRWAILLVSVQAASFAKSSPTFEVASVKPYTGPRNRLVEYSASGPRVRLHAYTIRDLLLEAYDLRSYELTFGPSTRSEEAYDPFFYTVEANAAGDGTRSREEFRAMLRALLAERFGVKLHRELKELPVYALLVENNGPKFKESAPDAKWVSNHGVSGRRQNITASRYQMKDLASELRNYVSRRPVVDRTGLSGLYDFKLEATPEDRLDQVEPGDIDIFTAIKQQLGLKLEAQKAKLEVVVVDHFERPSAN